MNECDLYRQISKATGESMRTIAALGSELLIWAENGMAGSQPVGMVGCE